MVARLKKKVGAFHEHVGGDETVGGLWEAQHGGVVADAERHPRMRGDLSANPVDKCEFIAACGQMTGSGMTKEEQNSTDSIFCRATIVICPWSFVLG